MSWRALAAAAVFVAMIVAALLLFRATQPPEVETAPAPPPAPTPKITAPSPPLDRADLVGAAARAADAYAQGLPAPAENVELAGRRFALRLPFGCEGPGDEESGAWAFWTYDEERETLRATVTPEIWTDADFVRAAAGPREFEAAEGFWLSRPWMTVGECPAAARQPERPAPGESRPERQATPETAAEPEDEGPAGPVRPGDRETLAIVEFFEPGSRRAARRNGRPYRFVGEVPPLQIDLSRGLRLVIEGRLTALEGGQPIACTSRRADERPLCVVGADVARIAITDAAGERTFAEWAD